MGRLIAAHCASLFCDGLTFAGFRVVFAVGTEALHDGSSPGWDLPRWTTHSAVASGAPHQAGWSSPRPGRDVRSALAGEHYLQSGSSGCHAGGPVEELAGPQHGVHHNRELSRHGDRGSLEADFLAQPQPP